MKGLGGGNTLAGNILAIYSSLWRGGGGYQHSEVVLPFIVVTSIQVV